VFTGLIRFQGQLRARAGNRLRLACPALLPGLSLGDSVAVNGVCLTAAQLHADGFSADLLNETQKDTTLGALPLGAALNLEPALRAGEPLGGHYVQGHVDGVVRLLARQALPGGDWRFEFELPEWLAPLVVDKGSIAIDGISLTLQELGPRSFSVALIPTTWNETNMQTLQPGSGVNIEADLIIKTVRRTVEQIMQRAPGLTPAGLRELGYGG
jgi:riboflavin synthase